MKKRYVIFGLALLVGSAHLSAQVREIAASGEYRMGDTDTKVNARHLALEEAKRNVLEQAGTFVSGLTEVKNLQITVDQIRTYMAGIVQLAGDPIEKTAFEGGTQVIHIDIHARIDASDVVRQLDK